MEEVNELEVKVVVTSDVEDEESKESNKNDRNNENGTTAKTDEMVLNESIFKEYSKTERSKSLNAASDLEDFDSVQKRVVSIVSLNELGGDILIKRPSESSKSSKSGIRYA